jgi:hypothetical protein
MLVLSLIAVAAFGALVPLQAASQSAGMTGVTRNGCTCHNSTETQSVGPQLEGLPGTYKPGKVYTLDAYVEGAVNPGSAAIGGFDLHASAGELMVPEGCLTVRIDPSTGEATHTTEGNKQRTWSLDWRAPEEDSGTVTFTLVVNMVNGDGIQSQEDMWGREKFTVEERKTGGALTSSAFITVIAVSVVAAIIAAAYYITRGPRIR